MFAGLGGQSDTRLKVKCKEQVCVINDTVRVSVRRRLTFCKVPAQIFSPWQIQHPSCVYVITN